MKLQDKHIRIVALTCLILTFVTITIFSLMKAENVAKVGLTLNDKVMHFAAYTALGFFFYLTSRKYALTILFGFAFSFIIEILQEYNSRAMEALDLVANLSGLIIGILCVKIFLKIIKPLME